MKRILGTVVLSVALGMLPAAWAGGLQSGKPAAAQGSKSARSASVPAREWAGTWYSRFNGRLFALLSLSYKDGQFSGKLTMPQYVVLGADGYVEDFGRTVRTVAFRGAEAKDWRLRFSVERNGKPYSFTFRAASRSRAQLQAMGPTSRAGFRLKPWPFRRGSSSMRLSSPKYSPRIKALQQKLRRMVRADQAVRTGEHIDPKALEAVDARHRPEILSIFKQYGWPRWSVVGHRAENDFWLLVQHQTPAVQRKLLPSLRRAVAEHDASRVDYAYLYDRVMVGEGKPQLWGTQAACKDGKPVLSPVKDPAGLEKRREALRMGPEAEYLKMLVPMCQAEDGQAHK